jgi:hypothetical protein
MALCTFSEKKGIKVEITKRNFRSCENTCETNNMFLNEQWVTEEVKREINNFLK